MPMKFDILTLFPDLVTGILSESIIGRAVKNGCISVTAHNIRDYSTDRRHRVDDTPYGGGMGMLISAEPVCACFDAVCAEFDRSGSESGNAERSGGSKNKSGNAAGKNAECRRVIYMSPKGKVLTQKHAEELARGYDRLVILCGHYEGIDCRATDEIVDEEISIGDYVLTGGELPACILVDCVARLIPGVLSDPECYENESISSGLLEYPQYTRPAVFRGKAVPGVLQNGNHADIERWRFQAALDETVKKRPDLIYHGK